MKKQKLLFEKRQIKELTDLLQGIRKNRMFYEDREAFRKLSDFRLIHTANQLTIIANRFPEDLVHDLFYWITRMRFENRSGQFSLFFCASDLVDEVVIKIIFSKYATA